MRCGHTAGFVALLSPLFLMMGVWTSSADDGPPKRHPSPKAVFDAYREARARRDHRTYFSFLTSEVQDYVLFETYFSCAIKDSKETNEILKRHGVDEATLTSDLRREYKAKHGVEPADDGVLNDYLKKEYKAAHGVDPPQPRDIMTDILLRRIKDKAGFREVALNLHKDRPVSPIGDLEQVVVQDDTATGHAAVPLPVAQGKTPGSNGTIDKTFHFRKVNGGWLLDSL